MFSKEELKTIDFCLDRTRFHLERGDMKMVTTKGTLQDIKDIQANRLVEHHDKYFAWLKRLTTTDYNTHTYTADSIDKTESWCDIGTKVKGLMVELEGRFFIMIEAGESGEFWLEKIEVDKDTIEKV